MRKIFLLFFLVAQLAVYGQWKIGVGGGPSINAYSNQGQNFDYNLNMFLGPIDKTSFHSTTSWGASIGAFGQYSFCKYFGIRADISWTQKNISKYFHHKRYTYNITNNYLQMPVVAIGSLPIGRFTLYLNAGVYGAYWMSSVLNSNIDTTDFNGINSDYDNRFSFGLTGGLGVAFAISKKLSIQLEANCYYDLTSAKKKIRGFNNPRYNTTFVFQPLISYTL